MYKNYIGFGIAGNFAHLDKAGEASGYATFKVKLDNVKTLTAEVGNIL